MREFSKPFFFAMFAMAMIIPNNLTAEPRNGYYTIFSAYHSNSKSNSNFLFKIVRDVTVPEKYDLLWIDVNTGKVTNRISMKKVPKSELAIGEDWIQFEGHNRIERTRFQVFIPHDPNEMGELIITNKSIERPIPLNFKEHEIVYKGNFHLGKDHNTNNFSFFIQNNPHDGESGFQLNLVRSDNSMVYTVNLTRSIETDGNDRFEVTGSRETDPPIIKSLTEVEIDPSTQSINFEFGPVKVNVPHAEYYPEKSVFTEFIKQGNDNPPDQYKDHRYNVSGLEWREIYVGWFGTTGLISIQKRRYGNKVSLRVAIKSSAGESMFMNIVPESLSIARLDGLRTNVPTSGKYHFELENSPAKFRFLFDIPNNEVRNAFLVLGKNEGAPAKKVTLFKWNREYRFKDRGGNFYSIDALEPAEPTHYNFQTIYRVYKSTTAENFRPKIYKIFIAEKTTDTLQNKHSEVFTFSSTNDQGKTLEQRIVIPTDDPNKAFVEKADGPNDTFKGHGSPLKITFVKSRGIVSSDTIYEFIGKLKTGFCGQLPLQNFDVK